jgi:membrane dipeptidase
MSGTTDIRAGAAVAPEVLALHRDLLVFDCLSTSPITAAQAQKMADGGLTGTNMTVPWVTDGFHKAAHAIVRVRQAIHAQRERMIVATQAAQIRQAKESGRTAIVIGAQNGKPVEDSLDNLDALFHMGMRVIQLTYNERNYIGDGCTERRDGGLSDFGVAVVARMAELGLVVDLSHCSEQTCLDAIEASPQPVIISHANPSALMPNPRNKSDRVLRALAARGGVVGACAWSPLLARDPQQRPTLADFLDAIDCLVQTVGIDHVAIGTDHGEGTYVKSTWGSLYLREGVHARVSGHLGLWWQFEARFPPEIPGVTELPRITAGLLERGYSEEAVRRLWGLNIMRVLDAVLKE